MSKLLTMPAADVTATFDPIKHAYMLGSVSIPSVTDVIRLTGLCNGYSGVPKNRLAAKAKLGKHVHSATDMVDRGVLDWDTVSPKEVPYVLSYEKAAKFYGFKVLRTEESMVATSGDGPYGMTLDRFLEITAGDDEFFGHWVLDLKNTAQEGDDWDVQTAAYKWGLIQNYPDSPGPVRRGVLWLKKDGSMGRLLEYTNQKAFDAFFHGLAIVHFRLEREGIGFDQLVKKMRK